MKTRAFCILLAMVAAAPATADGVHARLQTPVVLVAPNDEFDVEFAVFEADEPFNAFDASIRFDPARVTYVAGSNQVGTVMTSACPSSPFHVFSAAPDSLKISVGLLCAATSVTGPGVLYRARFRAGPTSGSTTLSLGPFTAFYNAGFFVTPLERQDVTVCVTNCTSTGVDGGAGALSFAMRAPRPNPWVGRSPASFEFDLPADGAVTLTLHDVSGRAIATGGPEWFAAGRHAIALARPEAPAGVYFARLRTPHGSASRAVVLTP